MFPKLIHSREAPLCYITVILFVNSHSFVGMLKINLNAFKRLNI
uniref:Uncharacterized protein n=1 Tax=Anguilla anguilla TaxID=7936 RepID=A0A0E9WY66_ANGAN